MLTLTAREQQFDLRTMTAGIAAAALVFTGSAQAGVILEQPEVKKVQDVVGVKGVVAQETCVCMC